MWVQLALQGAGETVDWDVVQWSLLFGVIVAAVVTAFFWAATEDVAEELRERVGIRDAQGLAPAAKWNVSDSWASNLTALTTAAAAAVVTLQDEIGAAIAKDVGIAFAVGGAIGLFIAALAPLAYSTFQRYHPGDAFGAHSPTEDKRTKRKLSPLRKVGYSLDDAVAIRDFATQPGKLVGTYYGLLSASYVTLAGTYMSLALIAFLFQRGVSGRTSWVSVVAWIVVIATSIVIALYAVRTLYWLLLDAFKKPESDSSLAGAVSVDCCASEAGVPARRASLL